MIYAIQVSPETIRRQEILTATDEVLLLNRGEVIERALRTRLLHGLVDQMMSGGMFLVTLDGMKQIGRRDFAMEVQVEIVLGRMPVGSVTQ